MAIRLIFAFRPPDAGIFLTAAIDKGLTVC